jgi:hypothetical protein
MRRPLLLLLVLVLAFAAGCSGGDDDADEGTPPTTGGTQTQPAADAKRFGKEDPQFGRLLLQFTKHAETGNTLRMWNMLTGATQASIGPTLPEFRDSAAREFQDGLGSLAETAEVIVSRQLDDFGLAAIAGEREVAGRREYYAYAVAFLQEENAWKIELGGIIITGLRPEPLSKADPRPRLAADVGAGADLSNVVMFLDGKPFRADRTTDSPFAAQLRGQPSEPLADGRHTVVVFAESGLTASGIAWTFRVGDATSS